jgi:hypothetical protein
MSSSLSALLSATFYEDGYEHLVELVHQRDTEARRHLASLELSVYGEGGERLASVAVDPVDEVLDIGEVARPFMPASRRVMIAFDARYEQRIFPYRPHHYGYLHRRGSPGPPLYYAVNAVLGGVPDHIGATGINNMETYLFRGSASAERYSILLGNLSRFSGAEAQLFTYYGAERVTNEVALAPKAHAEVEIAAERDGQALTRVDIKALFKLASYVVGRHAQRRDLLLFDHLFTYFR